MAAVESSSALENDGNRRKSARSIRKPDLFSEEQHEGSLLSNGSAKRKRIPNSDAEDEQDVDDAPESSQDDDSEGDADEEELNEKRKAARPKKSSGVYPAKKAKTSNGIGTALAIRSANAQSKPASKAAKAQQARSRQSQANQAGLYGIFHLPAPGNPLANNSQRKFLVVASLAKMQPPSG